MDTVMMLLLIGCFFTLSPLAFLGLCALIVLLANRGAQ